MVTAIIDILKLGARIAAYAIIFGAIIALIGSIPIPTVDMTNVNNSISSGMSVINHWFTPLIPILSLVSASMLFWLIVKIFGLIHAGVVMIMKVIK